MDASAYGFTQTSVKPEACSASLIKDKSFYNAWDLPEVPSKVVDYIKNGLPDAPSGKFVSKVYDHTGKEITDIKFEVKSGVNAPSSDSGSSETSDYSETSNAGSLNGTPSLALGGVGGLFMLLVSLL
ncbi:hypothetical protein PENNAL_c0022G01479 [Penicillium nalgiovense]|uniref:Uncharacterized protein n=1 Tax=Penicillium nalgiovense TaxID=60175 RepID=A0A1V6YG58_PENNA|nr:hypothetical protein PENNAL_c0022G01479 [Penicillium nalgiovense]